MKEFDFIKKLKEYGKLGLLTDNKSTPQEIARELIKNKMDKALIYVGENLSYENEKIYEYNAKDLANIEYKFEMNVTVLKWKTEN